MFSYLLVVWIWRHQKHDYVNYDRFVANFYMAYQTIKHVSLSNLKSVGPTKTVSRAEKVGEFSIMLWYEKWAGRCSLAYQHGCCSKNVWRFSKLWTAITFTFIGVSSWNLELPRYQIKTKGTRIIPERKWTDVIALNETFFSKKHNFRIAGYDTIRNDRSTGQGRVVAFLVKHGLVVNKEYRNNDSIS